MHEPLFSLSEDGMRPSGVLETTSTMRQRELCEICFLVLIIVNRIQYHVKSRPELDVKLYAISYPRRELSLNEGEFEKGMSFFLIE